MYNATVKKLSKHMCRLFVLMLALFLTVSMIPTPVSAAESKENVVRVGYYENEVFQEGAQEGAVKTGYAYEYYQKISEYTGWRYEYEYGEFGDLYQMLLDGKIDLIVTKSVSRFARNTVDSLTTIRELKEHSVECYFEKENIWTFDGKGELLITIMSSLAQEESRSISENCTWGQRKRFADGKVTVPFKRFLGYDRGPNGELVVNEEQAKLVKQIYRMFMKGTTPYGIATKLTEENSKW